LDDDAADRMYRDYAKIGTALQLPAELWPADRAAFRRYWENCLTGLAADDVTSDVARSLLYPREPRPWQRVVMPFARFITAGLLPDQLRKDFGLPWTEGHGRWFDRGMRWSAVVYPRLPRRIRHWPKNYCLGRLRAA
jgi:uncharacterized protein (DUF2236 family)